MNYGRETFYNIGPCHDAVACTCAAEVEEECWAQCYKTFYVHNLRIFVISLSVRTRQAIIA